MSFQHIVLNYVWMDKPQQNTSATLAFWHLFSFLFFKIWTDLKTICRLLKSTTLCHSDAAGFATYLEDFHSGFTIIIVSTPHGNVIFNCIWPNKHCVFVIYQSLRRCSWKTSNIWDLLFSLKCMMRQQSSLWPLRRIKSKALSHKGMKLLTFGAIMQ